RASTTAVLLTIALAPACAPLATFRPPSAFMGGRTMEMGLGAATVGPRPYVDERWLYAGQTWFTVRAAPWLHLSAISTFDPRAVALGGAATALAIRADRFVGGAEVELGYGWAAAGLPMALRLFEEHWLYTAPRVGNFGIDPAFGLPIGISLHLHGAAFARFEYQTSWVQLQAFNQRNHVAAALAVQW